MPAFLVELPEVLGRTLIDQADRFVVFAEDEDDAVAIVQDHFGGDSDALVAAATVTEVEAAADLAGFTLKIHLTKTGETAIDVEVVGGASDTIDDLGAAAETALNATASIANAGYTSGTNTLVIAEGASDALGDWTASVQLLGPNGRAAIPAFVGAITDEGLSSADLSVVFGADTVVVPAVLAALKS